MTRTISIGAVLAALLALPAPAFALRYASPTGISTNNCATPATACDLDTAIEGDGGSNVPSNGEEVIVLSGTYNNAAFIVQGAPNMYVHGDFGGAPPLINDQPGGELQYSSGTLSYLAFEGSTGSMINLNGSQVAERLFIRGSFGGSIPVCQCYLGTLRDSVVISTGTAPALGVQSSGGSGGATYRNVTAYATNAAAPAIAINQGGASGTLSFSAYNVIALNAGGGNDVYVDGPDPGPGSSTITFDHSNYRTVSEVQGGQVLDSGGHQTDLPLFTDAGGGDFSERVGSPTINAGLTDPLNGMLDFAGNPRVVDGSTDIGAFEYVPPAPPQPPAPPAPPAAPPTFGLAGGKVKVKPSGKGALGLSCTSPPPAQCIVVGTLTAAGAAKRRRIGSVSGTVQGGSSGKLLVKLTKRGRRALGTKGKLRASLSGTVTNAAGARAQLSAPLRLKLAG